MTRLPDDKLDSLLNSHLREQLDPQRGRAAQAFRAHLAANAAAKTPPRTHRIRPFLMLAIPLAAAACALLAFSPLNQVTPPTTPAAAPTSNVSLSARTPDVDDVTLTRNVDGGTIVFDNTPTRVVIEQQLRHTQWFDPQKNTTMTLTKPQQNVKLVALEPY